MCIGIGRVQNITMFISDIQLEYRTTETCKYVGTNITQSYEKVYTKLYME